MLSTPKLAVYLAFLLALAVWMGGGVFETIASAPAWSADPVRWVRTVVPPDGSVNPWPFTTAAMALTTLALLAAFARHRGPGRREAMVCGLVMLAVLVATGVYFVPTLMALAGHATLSDAEIVSMSHLWIRLNLARIALLLGLFVYALVGLARPSRPAPTASA
jgi:hypothetical protein